MSGIDTVVSLMGIHSRSRREPRQLSRRDDETLLSDERRATIKSPRMESMSIVEMGPSTDD